VDTLYIYIRSQHLLKLLKLNTPVAHRGIDDALITSPAGAYCGEYVCLPVCLRGYLRNHTRDLYNFFARVAYVCGSAVGPPPAC